MLKEDFAEERGGTHACLFHAHAVARIDVLEELGEERKEHFVEARFPFHGRESLQLVDEQSSLQVLQRVHAHLAVRVAAETCDALQNGTPTLRPQVAHYRVD